MSIHQRRHKRFYIDAVSAGQSSAARESSVQGHGNGFP